jgi:hypothetical protein
MAIGPEARGMASGRIVVATGLFAALGTAAIILGFGPLTLGAGPTERAIGGAVMGLGALMVTAAASLATRRGPARLLGTVAGAAMSVLGGTIAIGALASFGSCQGRETQTVECSAVVSAAGLLGLAALAAGIACLLVVRRARPASLRRPRRSVRRR